MKTVMILAAFMALAAVPAGANDHAGHHGHDHGQAEKSLRVEDAWARAALAGGNGAAYARIVNDSEDADKLIAVKGEVSSAIEIHEMSTEDGVMKMRRLDALDVPAKSGVELKPGGNHIMLIGLTDALTEGSELSLVFVFEKAGEVSVTLPVHKAGGGGHDHKH